MSTNIRERAAGPGARLVGLLATIRWEAQFKLAKCCMRASKSISDLGVFLAEPVLERSKAMNDVTARLRESASSFNSSRGSRILANPLAASLYFRQVEGRGEARSEESRAKPQKGGTLPWQISGKAPAAWNQGLPRPWGQGG